VNFIRVFGAVLTGLSVAVFLFTTIVLFASVGAIEKLFMGLMLAMAGLFFLALSGIPDDQSS
jgi:hypothetical protein